MSAAPDIYIGPAFVGWRSWRVMPFERLGEEPSVRLCACGTQGLPKLWEPRAAVRAVCGKFKTTHDAPWAGCVCGFYAYRSRPDAEAHLQQFLEGTNGEGALAWAFGRVSLWGRIVECERGWRAEYAYPYDLTVYGPDELAARVRDLYAVDVVAATYEPMPADEATDMVSVPRAELEEIREALAKVEKDARELAHDLRTPAPSTTDELPPFWKAAERTSVAALTRIVKEKDSGAARAIDVAKELRKQWSFVHTESVALKLYRAWLAGEVIKLRGNGSALWTLPGQATADGAAFEPAEDKHAAQDAEVLEALKVASAGASDGAARTRDVVAAMGGDQSDRNLKAKVTQSLIRLTYRGKAKSLDERPIERWRPVDG